ncbi:MAG: class I SAM-dependent methyltransferase, partial [Pseudomonadota bacterium]
SFLKRLEWFFTALPKLGDTFRRAKVGWRRLDALETQTQALSDDRAHDQAALDAAIEASHRDTATTLETALMRLETQTEDRVGDLTAALEQIRRSLDRLEMRLQSEIAADQARSAAERAITARAYGDLTRRVDLLRFQGSTAPVPHKGGQESAPADTPSNPAPGLEALLDACYNRIEARLRGSREEIAGRLVPYLADVEAARSRTHPSASTPQDGPPGGPLVAPLGGTVWTNAGPLPDAFPEALEGMLPVLDIGCGRGEWLELLAQHRIPAYGVDLNPVQAAEALAEGLPVIEGDAIAHLERLPAGCLSVVSAHHLIEHLPFPVIARLVRASLHALAPGGLLMLETPNPGTLIVGARNFHFDPTHIKPLPAEVLTTLLDTLGFHPVEARFLHPSPTGGHLVDEGRLDPVVADLLFGPMDLAVLGIKPAAAALPTGVPPQAPLRAPTNTPSGSAGEGGA